LATNNHSISEKVFLLPEKGRAARALLRWDFPCLLIYFPMVVLKNEWARVKQTPEKAQSQCQPATANTTQARILGKALFQVGKGARDQAAHVAQPFSGLA
jgi:hypothetical protein